MKHFEDLKMPDTEKPDDEKAEQQQSAADPAEAWGSTVAVRESEAVLPEWLDDFISEIGAFHSCGNRRYQHTLDLTVAEVKVYLGTYFPRSWCEAFCIAGNLFRNERFMASLKDELAEGNEINILDIGCGSGGEIIGLLDAIREHLPHSVRINVHAFDGNEISLGCMRKVAEAYRERFSAEIKVTDRFRMIESDSDLAAMADEVRGIKFDFILFCKTGNELISREIISDPYMRVAELFSGLLNNSGLLLILDVTMHLEFTSMIASRPVLTDLWVPQAMSGELCRFVSSQDEFGTLIPKPCGRHPQCRGGCYMKQTFTVRHSGTSGDVSKVCYWIICRNSLKDKLVPDSVMDETQIFDPDKSYNRTRRDWRDGACQYSGGDRDADAFNLNS